MENTSAVVQALLKEKPAVAVLLDHAVVKGLLRKFDRTAEPDYSKIVAHFRARFPDCTVTVYDGRPYTDPNALCHSDDENRRLAARENLWASVTAAGAVVRVCRTVKEGERYVRRGLETLIAVDVLDTYIDADRFYVVMQGPDSEPAVEAARNDGQKFVSIDLVPSCLARDGLAEHEQFTPETAKAWTGAKS